MINFGQDYILCQTASCLIYNMLLQELKVRVNQITITNRSSYHQIQFNYILAQITFTPKI